MQQLAKLLCTRVTAGKLRANACSTLSRIFLLCTAVLIVAMPWTEYFWHFDRFLRGGSQDFEMGLLAVLTSFCLVLLLFQLCRNTLQLAIVIQHSLVLLLRTGSPVVVAGSRSDLIYSPHAIPIPSLTLGMYTLPLQI